MDIKRNTSLSFQRVSPYQDRIYPVYQKQVSMMNNYIMQFIMVYDY